MAAMSRGIVIESHHGQYGEAGFDVTVWSARTKRVGRAAVLLKGGLGDPNSKTVVGLAEELINVSNGQLIVGTVGTTRPRGNAVRAVAGSFRARKHQSQSMRGASDYINDHYHPKALVLAGQSRGAVSAVDSALYQATHPKKNTMSPSLGVVTVDGPGVFQKLAYEGNVVEGLVRLGLHCLEDVKQMGWVTQAKMFGGIALKTSVFEPLYFANDVAYLKDVDISSAVESLREEHGIPVRHVFHRDDMVPGAEVPSAHSVVFEGGHGRFIREPEPVAAVIHDLALELSDPSIAA